ncbi:unnamed protein product [Colias eurytheme]|nr:unnamed protein product [Colias eurytheme]
MGLTSQTGLLASSPQKSSLFKEKSTIELRCEVTPAPFMLRPYAGLYNPFSQACSVLCNHPADTTTKEFVKRAKDAWVLEGKSHYFQEDLSKFQDQIDKEKNRTPHDIVTEDMFRRYTETDSRPLTPAPTLASGKSRGSRRCLTPDQPRQKTTIVLDLRRSHSQETLYYHGYTTSEMTVAQTTSATNERSTLPSLNLSEATHTRLIKGQCEQLPPLASPLVLAKRVVKEPVSVRTIKKLINMFPFLISKSKLLQIKRPKEQKSKEKSVVISYDKLTTRKSKRIKRKLLKIPPIIASNCDCSLMHVTRIVVNYAPKNRKRDASNIVLSMTWATDQKKRIRLPSVKTKEQTTKTKNVKRKECYNSEEFFLKLENQLKALNLGKTPRNKKNDGPASQRSKSDKDLENTPDELVPMDDSGTMEMRRRGKRRRKGRGGSDRLTSAGLAAQAQQDPETQIAGIGTDSQNPSSRASIAPTNDDDIIIPPIVKTSVAKKTDSFLDDDILKYLHREVDEEAIETEFDTKRRYVLQEALRTRPDRPHGLEMQTLLKEMRIPAVSLGDWLHIPRVFSRKNAIFGLPIDSNDLESLTPMIYAARFVTIKKSKQLLYLTVLRKFRPNGYRMPIKDIQEGLTLMMGGVLTSEQANQFQTIMEWDCYKEEENNSDDIKLTLLDTGYRKQSGGGDAGEVDLDSIKFKTWCGLCAICERMYGRFPPREKDSPDGIELSDFSMVETKIVTLKVHSGLAEILNAIRTR